MVNVSLAHHDILQLRLLYVSLSSDFYMCQILATARFPIYNQLSLFLEDFCFIPVLVAFMMPVVYTK
jgi:hypothetical protein